MSWAQAALGTLSMVLLWVLPGFAVLRFLGVRGLLALGAAPAVTTGLSGVLAIGYDLVGLGWSLWSFLAGTLAAVFIAGFIGLLLGTFQHESGVMVAGGGLKPTERAWLALTWVVGGGVLAAAMMTGMGRADQPSQAWDAVFHLNVLWFVRETGNATSLGGLAPMYADNIAPFYPAAWHALVSIAPGFPRTTEAANASSLVIGCAIWIAGLVALARVVWPGRALPTVLVPILAATFVTFPAIAVSMLAVWPYALSVACLPGTIALLIATLRGVLSWRMHLALTIALLWAVTGVVLAHASGLFSLILLTLPLVGVLIFRQLRRRARTGQPALATLIGVGCVVAVVGTLVFLVNYPAVRSIMDYQRGGQKSYLPGLGSLLIDHPLIYVYKITSVNLVVTVLTWIGIVLSIRRRCARWLVVALVAAVVLTLLAAGPPQNPARILAGFWYTQPSRLNALLVIPALILAAGGAAWLARVIANKFTMQLEVAAASLVLMVIVATSGLRWSSHVQVMASTYTTYPIAWGTILEPEEIEMIDRAGETLPEDAVVLGEAVAGSPYLLHRADVDVVFPQLSPIPQSPERTVLEQRFNRWRTDPAVCQAVRDLGITHVYADTLDYYDDLNAKYEETTKGLYLLDPVESEHWHKIDEGGHASLWEFTGCE